MNADAVWIIWVGVAGVSLVGLELWGLRRPGGTFSETLRRWLGLEPRRWWRPLTTAVFLGGLVVLAVHIVFG